MSKKKTVAKAKSGKYVYLFGKGKTDGNGVNRPINHDSPYAMVTPISPPTEQSTTDSTRN